MKSVLISIQPKWVEKIVNGEKTIEVRKTIPKIETPFKCYIYMSQGDLKDLGSYREWIYKNRMKIIGEFICDKVYNIEPIFSFYDCYSGFDDFSDFSCFESYSIDNERLKKTCLTQQELYIYGKEKTIYGWHISEFKIYDKPKELSEFSYPCPDKNYDTCYGCKYFYHDETEMCCKKEAVRPPQSWQYVEGN